MLDASEAAWRIEMDELTSSVARLIAQSETLRRRVRERDEEVIRLQARVQELEAELSAERTKARAVSAGRAFGPGSADAREAREMIKSMMREVDACIALLRS